MELTAQTLREVEFREKLRGYHPDDVDDFLEEAAVSLEELLERLNRAEAAARSTPGAAGGSTPMVRPERDAPEPDSSGSPRVTGTPVPATPVPGAIAAGSVPPPPPPPAGVTEHTLQRTLLLAQQTADAAIADAQQAAKRLLDEAHSEARRITEEANSRAADLRAEAQSSAAHSIAELEEQRAGLEHEVVALRSWAVQQRDRLRDALTDQVRSLDIWLSATAAPATSSAGPGLERPSVVPIDGGSASGRSDPSPNAPQPPTGPPRSGPPVARPFVPADPSAIPAPDKEPPSRGLVDHETEPDWLDPGGSSGDPQRPGRPTSSPENPTGGLFRRR